VVRQQLERELLVWQQLVDRDMELGTMPATSTDRPDGAARTDLRPGRPRRALDRGWSLDHGWTSPRLEPRRGWSLD
jgi:hypothetical protein